METSKNVHLALQKNTGIQLNQQCLSIPGDWQCSPPTMNKLTASSSVDACAAIPITTSPCSSVPAADTINPGSWINTTSLPSFGFSGIGFPDTTSAHNCTTGGNPVAMSSRTMFFSPIPGTFPVSLSNFPTDSAFVERAARFSCFGGGSFSGMVSSFGLSAPMTSYANATKDIVGDQLQKTNSNIAEGKDDSLFVDIGLNSGNQMNNHNDGRSTHVDISNNDPHEANLTESRQEAIADEVNQVSGLSPRVLNAKKRKKINQEIESEVPTDLRPPSETVRNKTENEQIEKTGSKPTGKQVKTTLEGEKEPFIHVRARRGQATNSHSLAERVRREKISERMKYLQDLVPGCSKVTGKAVMLDEIINYVQSLQRQVEFLSMKLASVNPRLDVNIEGLVARDFLHSHVGPSSANCFSQDMIHSQLQLSQHGLSQPGISRIVNHSDALRMNSQLSTMSSYKEPTLQMHGSWGEELHSVMQTTYGTILQVNSQESNLQPQDRLTAFNHQGQAS